MDKKLKRIATLEKEVQDLKRMLMSLKKFVGQEEEEEFQSSLTAIDPNEHQAWLSQLRATELEFSKAS